jgi:hypothetical protein
VNSTLCTKRFVLQYTQFRAPVSIVLLVRSKTVIQKVLQEEHQDTQVQKTEMQILGTSYLLLVLCCWAAGRLSEETIRFVEEYFTHKFVRVITSFTCSKQGTNSLSMSSGDTGWSAFVATSFEITYIWIYWNLQQNLVLPKTRNENIKPWTKSVTPLFPWNSNTRLLVDHSDTTIVVYFDVFWPCTIL